MTVINPATTTYEFNVELRTGHSLGTMERQPAIPQPGDVLELFPQDVATYYEVQTRRFTTGGHVVVVVDPAS
jgi:hypothetical protein